ncbi:hypothetical protein GCU56_05340 [Geodermatophilus sabuli]|uniref:Uncharacterized protein n=1 Tax=Geodermatophilus sabuli TaxID=1564158 RepID=A0A7K3W068_9ACTN|nr:hypothetical protein [Geodermatophilus sabuli]NEK57297.1 hypothetical protein [Geodermatophilus sabuli]
MTRTLAPRVLYTASGAAAVGLVVLAVAVVDAGASPAPQPASATSAPSTSSTSSTPSGTEVAPLPPAASPGEQVTVGGTVSATCEGGVPSYAGTPAPGWWADDSPRPGEVEFENGTQKVEIRISCVAGVPQFSVEGPRDDDRGRGRGSDDSPGAPAASTSPSGRGHDDSDGRHGGGHGSDDGPGDDSAGRVGGGHGSDDGDDSGRGRGRGRGGDD